MNVFKFFIRISRSVVLPAHLGSATELLTLDRDSFYEWLWGRLGEEGLEGVHEGTLLTEQAAEEGFETDSWTVDSGVAPQDRDWVDSQEEVQAELYFSGKEEAERAASLLKEIPQIQVGIVEEQKSQDWDAEWKASFLNSGTGVSIAPFWRVVPPWFKSLEDVAREERILRINPGAGFGTGTHETTQLCLEAIGDLSQERSLEESWALDFGSGSGILSIGLALLGARVNSVEVDPLAIDNARENVALNGVEDRVGFSQVLEPQGRENEIRRYRMVVANILRPVLLEFAEELVSRIEPGGALILSGLIEKDISQVIEKYSSLLGVKPSRVMEKGEWRGIVFLKSY